MLHQAPHSWFDHFSLLLLSMGFICSAADSSIFIHRTESNTILLCIYVDEIILTRSSRSVIDDFVQELGVEYAMEDLGFLH